MSIKHRVVRSLRSVLIVGTIVGSLASGGVAQASALTVLNVTVPGPVGGASLCVDSSCKALNGVANVHVQVDLNITSLTVPMVTLSTQPGCTANIDQQINVTTLGGSGSVVATVEWDNVDRNGAVLSHTSMPIPAIQFSGPVSETHSVSLCATLF